jgi:small subunit ribosomal protein S5
MSKNDHSERRDRSRERKDDVELIEKLVGINRITKVVKGGKRLGFAAIVVVGDGKGRVGHGAGKAREVPEAVRKATERARRSMLRIPLREGRTIHHDTVGRFGAGRIVLRSAKPGTGIIAGGAVRYVFEALGVQDIVAKSIGSSNPHNVLKAVFDALTSSNSPRHVAARRGKKVSDILPKKQVHAEVRE